MSKFSVSALALLLTAALLTACGSDKENTPAASNVTPSPSESVSASPSASPSPSQQAAPVNVDKLVADYKEIVELAEGKTDVKAVQQAYVQNFQSQVKAIDAGLKEGEPRIDENISFVLDHGVSGEMNPDQVAEATEKGLNWFFYLQMRDIVNKQVTAAMKAGSNDEAAKLLEQGIQAYTSVLEPFVEKRDAKFKTTMKDTVASAVIPKLRDDVKAGNIADYNVHRQMLDKTLIKAFTLATLDYGTKMPKVDKAELPKEMTEGYFLFLPVYSYLKGGSAADADAVKDAFASGDAAKVVPASIRKSLIACNTGKVKEYTQTAQQEMKEGKKDESRVHAMEAVMFLAAQETFLGADYANAAAAGEAFLKAVDEGKADEAKKQADAIMTALSKL